MYVHNDSSISAIGSIPVIALPAREAGTAAIEAAEVAAALRDFGQRSREDTANGERSQEAVAELIDGLNERLRPRDLEARFSMDEKTQRLVVQVVNREDSAVIWQYPSEKALAIAASVIDDAGVLIDEQA